MNKWIRFILALIVGIIVAFATVGLVEAVGHMVYPVPADLDTTDFDALGEYVKTLPMGALLFVLLAWTIATFVGGIIACVIAKTRQMLFAGIVGAMVLLASIANMAMIPHPVWFMIAAVVLIPAAAVAAAKLAPRSGE